MATRSRRATLVAGALGGAVLVAALLDPATATHTPANKVSAAGSTTAVLGPGDQVVLLSEHVRTGQNTDMVLGVTLECSIVTNVTTVGNDSQRAFGEVQVWVEIDDTAVPVASGDASGGKITFCNRAYQRDTSLFNDEDATIATFFDTKTANAFNWMALDVGNGVHKIEVVGKLTEEATSNAVAEAVVGNRTLIVDTAQAASDEEVSNVG